MKKTKNHHNVGIVLKSSWKIIDKDKIDTPNTHIHDLDTLTHIYDLDTPSTHIYDLDTPSTHIHDLDTPSTHIHDLDTPNTHT